MSALTECLAPDAISSPCTLFHDRRIPGKVKMYDMPAMAMKVDPLLTNGSAYQYLGE